MGHITYFATFLIISIRFLGLILLIIFLIILELPPKTVTFFLVSIFHSIGLICVQLFKEPFYLLINAIRMVFFVDFDWFFLKK